jgi:hypothetical protein
MIVNKYKIIHKSKKQINANIKYIKLNKTKQTRKQIQPRIYKGGGMQLIGEGTHGRIYKISNTIVRKNFSNRPVKQNCICPRIKTNCKYLCEHIHYEYLVQQLLYNSLLNTQCKIKIPRTYNFMLSNDNTDCDYEMDYIYPSIGYNDDKYLIQIDMGDDNRDEIISGVGRFLSYTKIDLSQCRITSLEELAFEIGQLFSYLHYILHIDGYDSELVIGRLYEENINDIFFIDFDKVSCFDFVLDFVAYRKIDESIVETKVLSNVVKFALFLMSGITGMSLLPRNEKLKNAFLEGYKKYSSDEKDYILEDMLEYNVYKKVIELILEY